MPPRQTTPACRSLRAADNGWNQLNREIVRCSRCPRLIEHSQAIGRVKRRAFLQESYWARPVPNFGTPPAPIMIVGLAPGAHGANRTGRMFTGDQSGVWLYRALHRAGLATSPHSIDRDDELRLVHCVITSACHCAPPQNRPRADELANCGEWLRRSLEICRPKVLLALGRIAWEAVVQIALDRGWLQSTRPKFHHGHVARLTEQVVLIGCYHPSQQNTFTGRLTEPMLDEIMDLALGWAGLRSMTRAASKLTRGKP